EAGQVLAVDLPVPTVGLGGLQPPFVGPAPDGVRADAQELGGLAGTERRHLQEPSPINTAETRFLASKTRGCGVRRDRSLPARGSALVRRVLRDLELLLGR